MSDHDTSLMMLFLRERVCNTFDRQGNNMLQTAIVTSPDNIEAITCLLELCPSLTRHHNSDDYTALHMAVSNKRKRIVEEIIRVDPGAIHELSRGTIDRTPFLMAIVIGELEIVKCMMAVDPQAIEQVADCNRNVLYFATDPAVVTYLLTCKPTLIDGVDTSGFTPFHFQLLMSGAMLPTYSQTVQILLEHKPTLLCAQTDDGYPALDIANNAGLRYVVVRCLQFDPSMQYQEKRGNTVLHLIAQNTVIDMDFIERMVTARTSELLVRNADNDTPLDIALYAEHGFQATTVFLLHCSLDDTIASYNKHRPSANIGTWALEQCSMLNSYLLPDLVVFDIALFGSECIKNHAFATNTCTCAISGMDFQSYGFSNMTIRCGVNSSQSVLYMLAVG